MSNSIRIFNVIYHTFAPLSFAIFLGILIFLSGLFNNAISIWTVEWLMNDKFKRIWKEGSYGLIKVLSWHLCGWTKENHKYLSG
jgi:hypothetical protein